MNWWVTLLGAAIGAGLLQMVREGISYLVKWKRQTQPERVEAQRVHDAMAQADQSIIVVVKSRGELERDNERIRATMIENDRRHAEERVAWAADRVDWRLERAELRKEIDAMEDRLQSALDEVQALKVRHDMTGPA